MIKEKQQMYEGVHVLNDHPNSWVVSLIMDFPWTPWLWAAPFEKE